MIEIFIDGRSLGVKGAGFTVLLRYAHQELKRTFKCGNFTSNQMELKGIEFALKAINPSYMNDKIIIYSGGRFGSLMLSRRAGDWYKTVKSNPELVDEIRRLWLLFPTIQIIFEPDNKTIVILRDETDVVIKG